MNIQYNDIMWSKFSRQIRAYNKNKSYTFIYTLSFLKHKYIYCIEKIGVLANHPFYKHSTNFF